MDWFLRFTSTANERGDKMRYFLGVAAMVVLAVARPASGAPGMAAPNLTVGRNLQAYGNVRLAEAAPQAEVRIVLTSDDPKRLLLSDSLDKAGSASVTLTVRPRAFERSEERRVGKECRSRWSP